MNQTVAMRSVEEAQQELLQHVKLLEVEEVALLEALGRTLAADITADIDVPPFANSSMDGYAVRAEDVSGASLDRPAILQITAEIAAGRPSGHPVTRGTTARIMTGAPMPPGADAVVPFEETDERRPDALLPRGKVRVLKAVGVGAYVRPAGDDMRAGELVLRVGTRIRAPEIAVLATVGAARVPVYRRPRVAILATGDELVEVHERPGPGQIRNSNGYANVAQVLAAGGVPLQLPVARDTAEELRARIAEGLALGADLFLTSGGVSVGDHDYVKQVLEELGSMEFWRVRVKPGKPLAFGHIKGVPLLGLPGNPVSAMVTFELFARPLLLAMQGQIAWQRTTVPATFVDELRDDGQRRVYARVAVEQRDGQLYARLAGGQGSNILTAMSQANGLMVVPEGQRAVEPGTTMQVLLLD